MKIIIAFLGLVLVCSEAQASCNYLVKPSIIKLKVQVDDQFLDDTGNELVFSLYSQAEKILEVKQEIAKQDVNHFLAVKPDRETSSTTAQLANLDNLSLQIVERDSGLLRRTRDTVLFKSGAVNLSDLQFAEASTSTNYFAGENENVWVQLQITRDCSQK